MHTRLLLVTLLLATACGDNLHFGGGQLQVTPQIGLRTNETGTKTTFMVALTNEPSTEEIVVALSSMDTTEGTVAPDQLVFTRSTFAEPQLVTVTGVDDPRADGNRLYTVRADGGRLGAVDLDIINDDDDTAGFAVSPAIGLQTSEAGGVATFTVRLLSQPAAAVTIPLTSSNEAEGTIDRAQLAFAPETWDQEQTVTVEGEQDAVSDGAIGYAVVLGVAASADLGYNELDPDDVQLVNIDDDIAGIAVVAPAPLTTSETGTQDSFTIVLQTQPAADVTIGVTSSATDEATASVASVVFTPQNWSTPQTVTVTGIDDAIDDGTQPFTIVLAAATSTDPDYAGFDASDPDGANADDADQAGILISPNGQLVTSEAGASDAFGVTLMSEPTADVTIAVTSGDPTEGSTSTTQLVFTPSNWNVEQTVTVNGVDDTIADGNQTFDMVLAPPTTGDATYAAIDPADVSVMNLDNDIPGFTIDPLSGLVVSEFGDADQFTIVLNTAPTADVTVPLSSSDPGEGTVLPTSVTFTPANWNVPQTVTVTGIDDALADGNIDFTIITGPAASTDAGYAFLNPADVPVTNIDNELAQVFVKARKRLQVSENGQSATFRVRLTVAPTATVTCTLFSNDLGEATVSPTTLVFQPVSFGFQTVTVTGVDDNLNDGDQAVQIVLNACTSTDTAYDGANPRDVSALNRDND